MTISCHICICTYTVTLLNRVTEKNWNPISSKAELGKEKCCPFPFKSRRPFGPMVQNSQSNDVLGNSCVQETTDCCFLCGQFVVINSTRGKFLTTAALRCWHNTPAIQYVLFVDNLMKEKANRVDQQAPVNTIERNTQSTIVGISNALLALTCKLHKQRYLATRRGYHGYQQHYPEQNCGILTLNIAPIP